MESQRKAGNLVRDQEVQSSNLCAPTIFPSVRLYAQNGGFPRFQVDQPHNTFTRSL